MPARLTVFQRPRNPSQIEREILTLLAEGHTLKAAAAELDATERALTARVSRMRDRYTAPTNAALVALAIRLQWIDLAIECAEHDPCPLGPSTSAEHPPSS